MVKSLFQRWLKHFLTPWWRALLEKLTDAKLVKKFLTLQGIRRLIYMFKTLNLLSLCGFRSIHSSPSHLLSLSHILILSSHLHLDYKRLLFSKFSRQICILCSVYSVFFYVRSVLCILFSPATLRFFRAFSSVVRQMPGYTSQRRGTVRTLLN
jgi:hypothetical protein